MQDLTYGNSKNCEHRTCKTVKLILKHFLAVYELLGPQGTDKLATVAL
jgi:hypothetical protein